MTRETTVTRVLAPGPSNVAQIASALGRGGICGIPTETVYGLAGNAFDPAAVARIFDAKERPVFDPLIVHVRQHLSEDAEAILPRLSREGIVDLAACSRGCRETFARLARAFWPGPLTLVLPRGPKIPDLVTSGLPTVAVRMPRHPLAQAILSLVGFPIAAPSANRFGRISPTTADHVRQELEGRVRLILDGGPCAIGVESTVLSLDPAGAATLLRPGATTPEAIEKVLGEPLQRPGQSPVLKGVSPGMLESHYAPSRPMVLLPSALNARDGEGEAVLRRALSPSVRKLGVLVFSGSAAAAERKLARLTGREVVARSLSRTGDLEEAARRLFAELRFLDSSGSQLLFAEPCPRKSGLGHAIGDRLRRASAVPR